MAPKQDRDGLIKIGQLAKLAGVLPSTIHFYTKEDLLKFSSETQGGYRLYHKINAFKRLQEIQQLQRVQRLTLEEIKKKLK